MRPFWKPGNLHHFRCFVGGKKVADWMGIVHGPSIVHVLFNRGGGTIGVNSHHLDQITPIRFGYRIDRMLPSE